MKSMHDSSTRTLRRLLFAVAWLGSALAAAPAGAAAAEAQPTEATQAAPAAEPAIDAAAGGPLKDFTLDPAKASSEAVHSGRSYQQRRAFLEARRKARDEGLAATSPAVPKRKVVTPAGDATKPQAAGSQPAVASAPADIDISFKLDALLSGPTYGGERWVSPPTYSSAARAANEITVEARAVLVDAKGQPVNTSPEWKAVDASYVQLSAGDGNAVRITVHGEGKSNVTVTAGGLSKNMVVSSEFTGNAMQVHISR